MIQTDYKPQFLIDKICHVRVERGHQTEALLIPGELAQIIKLDPQVRSLLSTPLLPLLPLLPLPPLPQCPVLPGADDEAGQGLMVADNHCEQWLISFIGY